MKIRDDDVVCDVIGAYSDALKAKETPGAARRLVCEAFADALEDPDDGPLVWIGLAEAQWTFGTLDADVVERVRSDMARGAGLERWREVSAELEARRRTVLADFVEKLSRPNPKPRKPPRLVLRPPTFAIGDCLSVRLDDGHFAAAIVIGSDASNPEYGSNLTGVLDWLGDVPPSSDVFAAQQWLLLTHHSWGGRPDADWYMSITFRSAKGRVTRVGTTSVDAARAPSSKGYRSWRDLGSQVVLQRTWNEKHPVGADLVDGWVVCRSCGEKWRPSSGDAPYRCTKCAQWVRVAHPPDKPPRTS